MKHRVGQSPENWGEGDRWPSPAERVTELLGPRGTEVPHAEEVPKPLSHPDSTKAMPLAWLHHNPGSRSGLLSTLRDSPKGDRSSATPRKSCSAKRIRLGLGTQRREEGVESLHLPPVTCSDSRGFFPFSQSRGSHAAQEESPTPRALAF